MTLNPDCSKLWAGAEMIPCALAERAAHLHPIPCGQPAPIKAVSAREHENQCTGAISTASGTVHRGTL